MKLSANIMLAIAAATAVLGATVDHVTSSRDIINASTNSTGADDEISEKAYQIGIKFYTESHWGGVAKVFYSNPGFCYSFSWFGQSDYNTYNDQVSSFYVEGGSQCRVYRDVGCTSGGIKKNLDDDLGSGNGQYNNAISAWLCDDA